MGKENIVILTGAGISAESGLKTFRDNDGLWEGHRVEDVATPEAFDRDPGFVQHFYNLRRARLQQPDVQPNAAHRAIADFERQHRGSFMLVTQNVDDLHQRSGSRNVKPMHGELLSAYCVRCQAVSRWFAELNAGSRCPQCGNNGNLRPDVVWFGEMPYHMEEIEQALVNCDLFIAIGTSGVVYPAAGFSRLADAAGAHTVELNLERSAGGTLFAESHYGRATDIVPSYLHSLLCDGARDN